MIAHQCLSAYTMLQIVECPGGMNGKGELERTLPVVNGDADKHKHASTVCKPNPNWAAYNITRVTTCGDHNHESHKESV